MTTSPGQPAGPAGPHPERASRLARVLRAFSVLIMFLTVPQVVAVWTAPAPSGVSLVSWISYLFSACLWLVYGIRKRDKTIYLACIGWILLDAAVVVGVLVRR
jgi:uncharacterized protein with PQ loop repeat